MSELRFTLVADGPSDKRLVPILKWLLRQHLSGWAINEDFADFRDLPTPPMTLSEKVRMAVDLYPCDLLFIHRDAENATVAQRIAEIEEAIRDLSLPTTTINVIPVRMQEAWLLIDERAIRMAAGNPNGTIALNLPQLARLETIPDPKEVLKDLLILASEASGRRLGKFRKQISQNIYKVSQNIEDYSALNTLSAFKRLESEISGWRNQLTPPFS